LVIAIPFQTGSESPLSGDRNWKIQVQPGIWRRQSKAQTATGFPICPGFHPYNAGYNNLQTVLQRLFAGLAAESEAGMYAQS
jgi:hypothetical protein